MFKLNNVFLYVLFNFFLISQFVFCGENLEEKIIRRIHAHINLGDDLSAVKEAEQAYLRFPESKLILEEWIRSLSRIGNESRSLKLWNSYLNKYPEEKINRELIEEMAWGILNKAFQSNSLIMRQMALLAAGFSREGKGMNILFEGMNDSNQAVREMAVKLAGHYRDKKLQDKMSELLKKEKSWRVRQQVIESIGMMEMMHMQAQLEAVLASDDFQYKEKKKAIASLLSLNDSLNRAEIERLAGYSRAEFRCLACQAIAQYQLKDNMDILFMLLKDPHSDVRREAFQALGILRPKNEVEKIIGCCQIGIKDINAYVGMTAAWVLTLYLPEGSEEAFNSFLNHPRQEIRLMSAAVLSQTGMYGLKQIIWYFQHHPDPFVKLNLALGLIGQRTAVTEVTVFLREMLIQHKEKWGSFSVGMFQAITNQQRFFSTEDDRSPELNNQFIRLELLNLLAILQDPFAQVAMKDFLKERIWGISGAASAFLLTEGDETAIDIVGNLLEDPQQSIRLQAALILSLWGKEENAIKILKEEYWTSDFETKGRILESLGRIGSDETIPFLMNVWKEPSQTLRVISAMAVVQCLYH